MKTFTKHNVTLEFYQKDGDLKYSFRIQDDPELTEIILSNVKTKRVSENKIKYAVDGIFNIIAGNIRPKKEEKMSNQNSIVELSELCQKRFGENITTEVLGKIGADHCPTVTVMIKLPNGSTFKHSARNKKIAKQEAAKIALLYLNDF